MILIRFDLVSVENESHCDFVKLREMLIRTNMEDMREKTHARHYELYRRRRLQQMGFSDVDADNKPVSSPALLPPWYLGLPAWTASCHKESPVPFLVPFTHALNTISVSRTAIVVNSDLVLRSSNAGTIWVTCF